MSMGHDLSQLWLRCRHSWTAKVNRSSDPSYTPNTGADLHRLDVLGNRAFLAPAFRVGHLLASIQVFETDTMN
jgi:hypothetical protein